MKFNVLASLTVFVAVALAPDLSFAAKMNVDPAHSSVTFEAVHLKLAKIPGRFTDFSGTIDLNEKDITKSKVDFTVKVASINTAVQQRDDHLRSPDFFDAAKFPEATFKSRSIKKSGDNFVLEGDLTIRGKKKRVSFDVTQLGTAEDPNAKVTKNIFRATGKINRKDFGVNYGPDEVVSDNIDLVINLETVPANPAK